MSGGGSASSCAGGVSACTIAGWKPFQYGVQLPCDPLPPPNDQFCRCQPGQYCTAPDSIKKRMVCPGTSTLVPPLVPQNWVGVCPADSAPGCPLTTCLTPAGGDVPCPDGTCPPMTGYACDAAQGCVPSSTSTLSLAECTSRCRYDCTDKSATNNCIHVLDGKFTDSACGNKCGTGGTFECTGAGCVSTPNGTLSADDCATRCRWQCAKGLCVRQLDGAASERTCGGQCAPFASGWRCDGTSGCVQDPTSSLSEQDCTAKCGRACADGKCGYQFGSTADTCPADCGASPGTNTNGGGGDDIFQKNLAAFIALFVVVGLLLLAGAVALGNWLFRPSKQKS